MDAQSANGVVGNVLSKLESVRRAGDEWSAICPAHDDKRNSLTIRQGDDARCLLHCHAGCSTDAVVQKLGLRMADLMPAQNGNGHHNSQWKIAATYDYKSAAGDLLYQVCRLEPKDFRQRKPKPCGSYEWKLGDVQRVLYRLPELRAAIEADENHSPVVYIVEGEKDCDRLRELGLIATTNAGGATASKNGKSKWLPVYSDSLVGCHVVVIPDNDEPGRLHAVAAAKSLSGKAASVRILELPGLPPKGDVSDWLDAGGTVDGLLRLANEATETQLGNYQVDTMGNADEQKAIANYTTKKIKDTEGNEKTITIPCSVDDIIGDINRRMGDWPRRVDSMVFVDDEKHGLGYFDRRTTAALFGWLKRHNKVCWAKGGNLVSQAELFAEIERTAQRYEAIELLPHEPPINGIYYRGNFPPAGDGSHLRKLLDRFRPETTVDRDLIQAAFMTPAWGGLPGCRPAFVITSDDGRGTGKSKVPETIGYLFGGHIDVSAGEDIEQLKTRMLTPGARTKRIALLDNVKSLKLSWAELEAMLTAPIISGRQLYVGEGQRPNLLTWFITLNGVSMATDMAQRSVIIKVIKGKNDGPWWEQTRQFIDEHREQIIGDIIAALRADPFPLADFTRWATWEQHVLCRLPEPNDCQRLILERQGMANCELDEAEIIEEHFANQLHRLQYDPETCQVRIPVATAARWYGWAVGESTKTASASKRLHQMAGEGQTKRIAPDPSRTYGRCFIWTGASADVVGDSIVNDLQYRIDNTKDTKDG